MAKTIKEFYTWLQEEVQNIKPGKTDDPRVQWIFDQFEKINLLGLTLEDNLFSAKTVAAQIKANMCALFHGYVLEKDPNNNRLTPNTLYVSLATLDDKDALRYRVLATDETTIHSGVISAKDFPDLVQFVEIETAFFSRNKKTLNLEKLSPFLFALLCVTAERDHTTFEHGINWYKDEETGERYWNLNSPALVKLASLYVDGIEKIQQGEYKFKMAWSHDVPKEDLAEIERQLPRWQDSIAYWTKRLKLNEEEISEQSQSFSSFQEEGSLRICEHPQCAQPPILPWSTGANLLSQLLLQPCKYHGRRSAMLLTLFMAAKTPNAKNDLIMAEIRRQVGDDSSTGYSMGRFVKWLGWIFIPEATFSMSWQNRGADDDYLDRLKVIKNCLDEQASHSAPR